MEVQQDAPPIGFTHPMTYPSLPQAMSPTIPVELLLQYVEQQAALLEQFKTLVQAAVKDTLISQKQAYSKSAGIMAPAESHLEYRDSRYRDD